RRSYENTMALFRDIAERVDPDDIPLIGTDGFEFYERVVWQVSGAACVYGQVLKTRRNNRIVKVDRMTVTRPAGVTFVGLGPYHPIAGLLNAAGRQSYFGHGLSGINGLKSVESVRAGLKVDILIR